jgi:endonuclease-3 related protein
MRKKLLKIYKKLLRCFGPQHWWPGETALEIIIGAILTQNTSWKNVEKAINRLKSKSILNYPSLKKIAEKKLAVYITSSGYYRIKARRIKNFLGFLEKKYKGKIYNLKRVKLKKLRKELLNINGIGPETADSILLYALNKPVFVIDAYTKRIFSRHNFIPHNISYEMAQNLFMQNLSKDIFLYNEFHALIVKVGNIYCKKIPECVKCPLNSL